MHIKRPIYGYKHIDTSPGVLPASASLTPRPIGSENSGGPLATAFPKVSAEEDACFSHLQPNAPVPVPEEGSAGVIVQHCFLNLFFFL